ncbi:Glycosyltransferase involved in cell wall bisynthesis [Salibacterium halotolerans]|uniref:Glycosyltransferase involved in cell wall bisynthesis n=2 Tax=Salibacterium halotolerans TaxID=1884432 RepID=A0A1I5XI68_9BACI|nr:Glycosyltransferase involved in cell wall bisynthesis [Salibacterium halotolerans]
MKKVCMLVHTHSFLDSRIFHKEAKTLQKNGYEVTMIVPRMKGKLFNIDKEPFQNKFLQKSFRHEGINIVTYNVESFKPTAPMMQKKLKSVSANFNNVLTNIGLNQQADIYHAHETASLYAGIGVKRAMKNKGKEAKLIFDSHDLIPDPFEESQTKNAVTGNLLDTMLKEVDQLITVSPSIKSWYIAKNPLLPIEVIYNSPPLNEEFQPKEYETKSLTVGYEGHIADHKKGSSDKIFKITDLCSATIDFRFKVIGGVLHGHTLSIPDHLQEKVKVTGWIDYQQISEQMKEIDVGWIDFDDLKSSLNRSYALPNKLFSYLNNGVPVVVNKCHEMEHFIRTHKCGMVINKTRATSEDYAEAFLFLHENRDKLKQMSINARKVMERIYSWEKMEKDLLLVYQSLTSNRFNSFYF